MQYKTYGLTKRQKVNILRRAYEVCDRWYVDKLDCRVSWCRQPTDMSFEDVMQLYDGGHLSVVYRDSPPENHLEIGFRQSCGQVDYFLWLILDVKHIPELTNSLPEWR